MKLAQANPLNVTVSPPAQGVTNPNTTVGGLVSQLITLSFIIGGLILLAMVVWGAIQWITAGGDKEKIGAAQKRITQSLIGFMILALAIFIVKVVGSIVHIDILNLGVLPTLGGQ